MNYTVIAYEEESGYYDRCGDFISRPAKFFKFFSTDMSEFAEKLAELEEDNNWDEFIILLDGKPEGSWTDGDVAEYDKIFYMKLDAAKDLKERRVKEKLEQERKQKEEEERKRFLAEERQRAADLATYENLKKKLGL